MQAEPPAFHWRSGHDDLLRAADQKKKATVAACLLGDLRTDQITNPDALAALKPLLADNSVLKISNDMKFDAAVRTARRGGRRNHDITLISYVLNTGRINHGA